MMKKEKIEKLAMNLSQMIDVNEVQEIKDKVFGLRKKYKDYFNYVDSNDLLKLILSIYSYKISGSFLISDMIMQRMKFIGVVKTEGESHIESCEECDGYGEKNCDVCNSGNIECDECQGDGEVDCHECDGSGEIYGDDGPEECDNCSGTGRDECGNCGGDGNVTCPECNGRDSVECDNCEGNGDITSSTEVDYETEYYCTWDKNLIDLSEIRLDTENGISEDEFEKFLSKEGILYLSGIEDHGEPMEFVEEDVYYVFYVDDELPKSSLRDKVDSFYLTQSTNFYFT